MFSLISSGSRKSKDWWTIVSAIWKIASFVARDGGRKLKDYIHKCLAR